MQRLVLFLFLIHIIVSCNCYSRHRYYPYNHARRNTEVEMLATTSTSSDSEFDFVPLTTTTTPRNVLEVDEHTGIKFNPFSKHHGRHVCITEKNVTYPVKTKQLICRPRYKKYMVRCGNDWCSGVRLVYEKYHRDVVTNRNASHYSYTCCPGWSQVTSRSHGCNQPICQSPCLNGGRCVQPNYCACPTGYNGTHCETQHTKIYQPATDPPLSVVPPACICLNNGVCTPEGLCICPPGFQGVLCQKDIDECKILKPCDQICYNTLGSYNCDCKENFILLGDKQTCRREGDDGTTFEAKDLEFHRLDSRINKLETMMNEKIDNEVTKKDLDLIYKNIGDITNRIQDITDKMGDTEYQPHKKLTRRKRSGTPSKLSQATQLSQPSQNSQPTQVSRPSQQSQLTQISQPSETNQTSETSQPSEINQPSEISQPSQISQPIPLSHSEPKSHGSKSERKSVSISSGVPSNRSTLLKSTNRKTNLSVVHSYHEEQFSDGKREFIIRQDSTKKSETIVQQPDKDISEHKKDAADDTDCDTDETYTVVPRLSGGGSNNIRKKRKLFPYLRRESVESGSEEVIRTHSFHINPQKNQTPSETGKSPEDAPPEPKNFVNTDGHRVVFNWASKEKVDKQPQRKRPLSERFRTNKNGPNLIGEGRPSLKGVRKKFEKK